MNENILEDDFSSALRCCGGDGIGGHCNDCSFLEMLSIDNLNEEQWKLIIANKRSALGKCMSSKGTAEGGRCFCCLCYGHSGQHSNPHSDETWVGETVEEQIEEEFARIEAL